MTFRNILEYKKVFLGMVLILCCLFLLQTVHGVSISNPVPKQVTFQKGMQFQDQYDVGGADKINVYIECGLPNYTKYITLLDPSPESGPRTIKVAYNMYEDLPPGRWNVIISARQMAPNTGSIIVTTGVQVFTTLLVLFPGKYIEWSTAADDGNINEKSHIYIRVSSIGTDVINDIHGKIDVYDEDNTFIRTVYTDQQILPSDKTQQLTAEFDTTGLKKGNYHYNATLYWDGKEETPKSGTFRIGSLEVNVVGYSKEFIIDALNVFDINVESDWNGPIKDVYATIDTPNKQLKTPSIDLERFKAGTLETYWDTTGLGNAVVNATIILHYVDKTTVKQVQLNISKTGEGVKPPVTQKPLGIGLSTTTIILLLVVILLVANFIFFFVRGLKKNEKK